jgi:hypothetical protein
MVSAIEFPQLGATDSLQVRSVFSFREVEAFYCEPDYTFKLFSFELMA